MENYLAYKGYDKCIVADDAGDGVGAKEKDLTKLSAAKAVLSLCIEPILYPHIRKCKSALEVWIKIHSLFEDRGHLRRSGLLKKLFMNRLEECESMNQYIGKLMNTTSQLENIGLTIDEDFMITLMLAGLNDEFKPFIMGLGAQKITSDELKMKLLDYDAEKEQGEAFFSKKGSKKANKKKNNFSKKQKKCFICQSPQHLANVCPEKQSKSETKQKTDTAKEKAETAFVAHAFVAHSAEAVGMLTVSDANEWYIDSGATTHMSPHKQNINERRNSTINEIKIASDERLAVEFCGNGNFMIDDNEITVNDILYVPKMSVNLLSVYGMVKHGNTIIFNSDGCKIYNKQNVMIAMCKPVSGVYKIKLTPAVQYGLKAEHENNDIMLWHRRFGHVNNQTMQKLCESVNGVRFGRNTEVVKRCKICPMGKHHREPFKSSKSVTTKVLELVHSDLCGPMKTKSIGGSKYMMTLTDDFSRKTFLFFMASKESDQVTNNVKTFTNAAENEKETKLKRFRSDNGTEFDNKTLNRFFDDKGIKHELTCTYTPQQNGVAERANRTIVERAKCMLFDANLGPQFWAEACGMAAYLMNRTPRIRLSNRTPEKLWSGEKPDVAHIRIFGSKAMVHVPDEKRSKWDAKSQEMIFVGYDSKKRGYRCYDAGTKKVIVSRDVQFYESLSSTVMFDAEEQMNEERNSDYESAEQDPETESSNAPNGNEHENNSNEASSTNHDETLTNNNRVSQGETLVTDDETSDEDYTTRAKIDHTSSPRRGSRQRTRVRQFQAYRISVFFLLFNAFLNTLTNMFFLFRYNNNSILSKIQRLAKHIFLSRE